MDLLLTHGYFIAEDAHERKIMKPYPPLGILSISAYLKLQGIAVEVFDTTFSSLSEFTAVVEQERPPVVGIYCNLMTKFNVLTMVQACKEAGALVVLGGPEPPNYAAEYLAHGVDVVVVGEGEKGLEELLPALRTAGPRNLSAISGIWYRDESGRAVQTAPRPMIPKLDELPLPDRGGIDVQRYVDTWRRYHGSGSISLICARGCPYHCTWCSHSVYGETHRRRSPERVVEEVESVVQTYRPDQLWYADDVFTIHPGWLFRYAALLHEHGLHLPFECITRADRLNEKVMDTLAEMGCFRVWIGSESGSQRILDSMRREVKVEQVQWASRELQKRGIQVGMFIMLGFEGEEEQDLQATVDHLKRSNPSLFLSTVSYPIKGTPYYRQIQERVLARQEWEKQSDRGLGVQGRHSRRYYEFAQRWMTGEFNLHRQLVSGLRNPVRAAKSAANIGLGRLGMALSSREVES